MNISKLLITATASGFMALSMIACSDSSLIKDGENGGQPEVTANAALDTESATLYKVTYNEDDNCSTFKEVKEITNDQAKAAGIASPMGLCEERFKPVENSKVSEQAAAEGDEDEEVHAKEVRFECIRISQKQKAMKNVGVCEG